ncbi:hypothetical protein ACLFKT_43750, partial [Paraburkholderia sp. BR14261]
MSLNAADRPQMSGVAGSTQSPEQAGPPIDVYFARQPMLDREGLLCAFETSPRLVDRRESAEIAQEAEAAAKDQASGLAPKPSATSTALLKSFAAPALRASLAGHPAWLDMTRDALFHDSLQRVSPERVMLELPVDIGADADLIARLVELHRR